MNSLKNNCLLLGAATVLFASCEKEVSLKIPPMTPKLTIVAYNVLGDYISAQVGSTVSMVDYRHVKAIYIEKANVKLYTNGIFTQNMMWDSSSQEYYSDIVAETGKQYNIKVVNSGFSEVEATANTSSQVKIDSFEQIRKARKSDNGAWQDELIVTFTDPPGLGDYYIIKVQPDEDTINYGQFNSNFCLYSSDPSIETVSDDPVGFNTCLDNNGVFIRDALFNGGKKQVKIYWSNEPTGTFIDSIHYHIELLHVSEAFFRYYKSYMVAKNVSGDPFSEPINVYSDVKNGYGIFAVVSSDRKTIEH